MPRALVTSTVPSAACSQAKFLADRSEATETGGQPQSGVCARVAHGRMRQASVSIGARCALRRLHGLTGGPAEGGCGEPGIERAVIPYDTGGRSPDATRPRAGVTVAVVERTLSTIGAPFSIFFGAMCPLWPDSAA